MTQTRFMKKSGASPAKTGASPAKAGASPAKGSGSEGGDMTRERRMRRRLDQIPGERKGV